MQCSLPFVSMRTSKHTLSTSSCPSGCVRPSRVTRFSTRLCHPQCMLCFPGPRHTHAKLSSVSELSPLELLSTVRCTGTPTNLLRNRLPLIARPDFTIILSSTVRVRSRILLVPVVYRFSMSTEHGLTFLVHLYGTSRYCVQRVMPRFHTTRVTLLYRYRTH
eukprot:COSAG02_NODE_11895_length_1633_cov_25.106910_1_plen_162_part_00